MRDVVMDEKKEREIFTDPISAGRNRSSLGDSGKTIEDLPLPHDVDDFKAAAIDEDKNKKMWKVAKSLTLRKLLNRKFPCFGFVAAGYGYESFISDTISGFTVALIVIPISIAHAALAELPLQYGLYASMMPGFIYAVFGTCKEVTIGSTAVNSLMSYDYAGPSISRAVTLAFWSGLIEIAVGCFNLGFLTNFISTPVMSAFTSAVAINVITSQVKGLLGLKEISGRGFRGTWESVFRNVNLIRPADTAIGFTCIGLILLLRNAKDFKFLGRFKIMRKVMWFITISRNCLVLILFSSMCYVLVEVYGMKDAFYITGQIQSGIPSWQVPWRFGFNDSELAEVTRAEATVAAPGPIDLAQDLGVGLLMLPLVSIIQIVAVAHSFSPPTKNVDSTQEILALGLCQLVGSFVGSLPITASLGRSSVNHASGVKTPFGGIVTGVVVIAACTFLTPHFAYVPTAALAAVIIASVIFTIDLKIVVAIWKSKTLDFLPYCLTLVLGIVVSVDWGMIAGTLLHLCMLLYQSSKPMIYLSVEEQGEEGSSTTFVHVQPQGNLNFPSVDRILYKVSKAVVIAKDADRLPIIFDLSKVQGMDFSVAKSFVALANFLSSQGQTFIFCGASQPLVDFLQKVEVDKDSTFSSCVNLDEAVKQLARP